jgi:DNA-binding NarL/FixJ family response regulator
MKLSDTDYSLLRELQQNEKRKRNYVKITVLLMLHLGKSAEEIGLCLGISAATVSNSVMPNRKQQKNKTK